MGVRAKVTNLGGDFAAVLLPNPYPAKSDCVKTRFDTSHSAILAIDDVLPFLLDLNGEELYVLLILYDHPERPIIPDIRFNLASLADANAEKEFRFDVRGVLELARLFELPEFVISSERDKAHKSEAVCILLDSAIPTATTT
ncbi:hypothetical protein PI125_g8937 [Phytophthora idaei]|nr:hypothetical protein PI125_g8937 [Phytophthora idaei]KAG3154736.1 hypothetical protein PI126_g9496 [Phytophthora idaei]